MTPKNKVIEIVSEGLNPSKFFDVDEQKKDIHSFLVIQRMVKQFIKTKIINEKLLINNIIIVLNVFGAKKVNHIFHSILKESEFGVVKSILLFLKCYTLGKEDNTKTNRIIDDILSDVKHRYNLEVQ